MTTLPNPRRLLLATCLTCLASAAGAADLPTRTAPPVFVPPAFTWTGFYAGVNAGAVFGQNGGSFTDPTYGYVTRSGGSDAASAGGGQIGYNYQFGTGSGFVVGLEADIQGVAGGSRGTYALGSASYVNVSPSLDWFGTVRARAGYAFDRVLVYATGGFAYGGGSVSSLAAAYPYSLPDTTRTGYAVGGGVEYAFTPSISAKVEGLYVRLNRASAASYYDAATNTYDGANRDDGFGVVRAGLNYRF